MLGYPEQARQKSHEALTYVRELSQPFSIVFALLLAGWLHQFCRDSQLAQEKAEEIITLSHEQGFPYFVALGVILRGWALATQGQEAEGITEMGQGLAAFQATGAGLLKPYWLALLAEAHSKRQTEEALRLLDEAQMLTDRTGGSCCEAELYRLKGELQLGQTIPDELQAETCFQQAIDVARRQQAKSWELRAAMSLARLWQQQGKYAEARDLLAPVYGWFTEGFDTADLQEAKALLQALSSGTASRPKR
jgi:predicted ATPase